MAAAPERIELAQSRGERWWGGEQRGDQTGVKSPAKHKIKVVSGDDLEHLKEHLQLHGVVG